jgi:hypothetical protein
MLARLFCTFLAGLFGPLVAGANDEAALERGQKYLERLAAAWTEKLPPDRTFGIYLGRRWVGEATVSVKAAPQSSTGAVFEWTLRVESNISGSKLSSEDRVLFGPRLALVSARSSEEGPEGKISKSLSVKDGRWEIRREEMGKATRREGVQGPGTTWSATFLPALVRPQDAELELTALDSDPPGLRFESTPDAARLEIRRGAERRGVWTFGKDSRPVEFRPADSVIRFRPVEPGGAGKDLSEPLELKAPVKALSELFRAIKRGDRAAVTAAFDFERFAQEMVDGYVGFDPATKKQILEGLQTKTPANLLTPKMRSGLPEERLMEDFFSVSAEATEKDGVAEVRLFGKETVWKLHQPTEGKRKGLWLVCGIR